MIHPTAIIHPGAKLGAGVSVGPYSIIGEHVEIARQMRGIWKYKAEAKVDGEVVAEAELMCAKRDVA